MMRVYLDHNATSPPSPSHLKTLVKEYEESAGNPSSPHWGGRAAHVALTRARKGMAGLLGFEPGEVIFLSGGSEANNLGTLGVVRALGLPTSEVHVVTSALEHPSVREPLVYLQAAEGLPVTFVRATKEGFVSPIDIVASLRPETKLIALMAANNEVGTLQPAQVLGDWLFARRWGETGEHRPEWDVLDAALGPEVGLETLRALHFHVDAVQVFGKVRKEAWHSRGFDSVAVSGHKLGSVSGTGVLCLRRGRRFVPLILGGAQERNRRAGTENLMGILSLRIVAEEMQQGAWWEGLSTLAETTRWLRDEIERLPGILMNTPAENILPNTVNFSVISPRKKGEDVLMELDMAGIAASSGSACSSGSNLPSQVLLAMGRTESEARNAIRLSLGQHTSRQELEYFMKTLRVALS